MVKDRLQEFTLRITQANRSELVVIMYEIIQADIDYAKELLIQNDSKGYEKECRHAQKMLNELMATLDYHYTISYDLLSLYSFCNKRLVAAYMKKDSGFLDEVAAIIKRLRDAYVVVSQQDNSGQVMKNTQTLYAGLTYGRNALNEASVGFNDSKRGFMA
jgi:flagellar protein FliS